ncbi:hypothetical protein AB0L67_38180 [Streptomyces flaveolus]|uniref:hypothetical protein n=1 Tax=Streptomyces flaveolus TaxID=67297 RepID=UPI00341DDABC
MSEQVGHGCGEDEDVVQEHDELRLPDGGVQGLEAGGDAGGGPVPSRTNSTGVGARGAAAYW